MPIPIQSKLVGTIKQCTTATKGEQQNQNKLRNDKIMTTKFNFYLGEAIIGTPQVQMLTSLEYSCSTKGINL